MINGMPWHDSRAHFRRFFSPSTERKHVQDSCPSAQRGAGQHEGKLGKPPDRVDVVEQKTHHPRVAEAHGLAQRAGPHEEHLALRPGA